MKNKSLIIIFLFFQFGCEPAQEGSRDLNENTIKSLRELVNDGFVLEPFYRIDVLPHYTNQKSGIILILPSSSCFNCFEDLNNYLKEYFLNFSTKRLFVIRNSLIKEREIRYSLQKVLPFDQIGIIEIEETPNLSQHKFFPKLGYFKDGKICCVEIFEQGNQNKFSEYFKYLEFSE